MGNENSSIIDENTPTQTLESRDIAAVAKLIKDGRASRIVVLTGAGISTAAGIPDFRSPKTGLYHNLARLNLPHAEAVFEIDYFKEHPEPFYVLAKELYPGQFHPTIAHAFIALLSKKNLLHMLFTQNIDCLERAAGVPGSLIVEAHGSFATQRCIECKTPFPDKEMREHVEKGEPPRCSAGCGGLVKPDIVFFGEQLPEAFFLNRTAPGDADLVLILGTSLSVQPFALLPSMASEGVPRVLFNKERVGDLGTRADDVVYLGDCDSGVRQLADELGWRDELEKSWRDLVGEKEAERQLAQINLPIEEREQDSDDEDHWLEDEIIKLTSNVEHKLEISGSSDTGNGANGPQVGIENTSESTATNTAESQEESKEAGSEGQDRDVPAAGLPTSAPPTHEEDRHDSEHAAQDDNKSNSAGVAIPEQVEHATEGAPDAKATIDETPKDSTKVDSKGSVL